MLHTQNPSTDPLNDSMEELCRGAPSRGSCWWEQGERDQRDADVAQLVEQAVQRRLVDHGAGDDGGAVVEGGEAQSVEPSVDHRTGPDRPPAGLVTLSTPGSSWR